MAPATSQPENPPPPPAPSDLPPDWKSATDGQGRAYYYHRITRQTQWDKPTGAEVILAVTDANSPAPSKKSRSKHKVI